MAKRKKRCNSIEIVSETEAKCSKCSQIQSINNFQFGRRGEIYEYRLTYCNLCRNKQIKKNLGSDINIFLSERYNSLKRAINKTYMPITISKQEYIDQYNKQDGKCFYSEEKMLASPGLGYNALSMSIDKIIPELGYIPGNFVFCTRQMNLLKNNLSLEEIQNWLPIHFAKIKQFLQEKNDL